MRTTPFGTRIAILISCALYLVSCNSDEVELIDPSFKTFEFFSGCEIAVPVLTDNWMIESVEDMASGKMVKDANGDPIALKENGATEVSGEWLTLIRDAENRFIIVAKENFDPDERIFRICINSGGDRDYVIVTQHRGREYKMIKIGVRRDRGASEYL
ncbi:MAG: hypothetical protein LUE93_03950 [Bacteroides sp.]|nr:hypothetical protein [Bacteroides sp.]